ncbi:hypothetical protein J0895_24955 [Phormidium pseudopriestleyi FRX01]|uniref:Uncharacterized protein n=1 Tax=Phormidium pseudopriestleyi FRX01 TaxID=1759528 RepID=A0ABS3FYX4_9CYAN|nr:hypothetical protein [Phormidium pseudopriestleyi]MBO0352273.1 hypothetical protein [Phormidium pseudopriestleyi FRX01]
MNPKFISSQYSNSIRINNQPPYEPTDRRPLCFLPLLPRHCPGYAAPEPAPD